jgi:hypothetical protein
VAVSPLDSLHEVKEKPADIDVTRHEYVPGTTLDPPLHPSTIIAETAAVTFRVIDPPAARGYHSPVAMVSRGTR